MKNNMKGFLVILLLFVSISKIQCAPCSDIPLIAQFQSIITSDTHLPQSLKTALTIATDATPGVVNATSLGVCSQVVDTTSSCCSYNFVSGLQQLVKLQTMGLLMRRPPVFQIIQDLERVDKDLKCGIFAPEKMQQLKNNATLIGQGKMEINQTRPEKPPQEKRNLLFLENERVLLEQGQCPTISYTCSDGSNLTSNSDCSINTCPDGTCPLDVKVCSPEEILSRTKSGTTCSFAACSADTLQSREGKDIDQLVEGPLIEFRKLLLQCQMKAVLGYGRFLLGQSCAMCIDPTTAADYFATYDLKVAEVSFEQYIQDSSDGLTCMTDIMGQLANFAEVMRKTVDNLSTQCTSAYDKFKTYITAGEVLPCPSDQEQCKANMRTESREAFGNPMDSNLRETEVNLTQATPPPPQRLVRILTASSIVPSSTGGFSAYVIDTQTENAYTVAGLTVSDNTIQTESSSNIIQTLLSILALIVIISY